VADSHFPVCDYEGSKYSSEFWTAERAYEDQAEAIALQQLLPENGNLLLELGSGTGRNTLRYTGFKQVVLLDYSLSQLQQAQQNLGRNQRFLYVAADIYQLPFVEGLFDAATMIRTLHHMADPLATLKQVRSALQSGAIFILEYANKQNLKSILRYYLHKQSWSPFDLDSVEFEKLNFDFHPQMIGKWLKEANFELQKQLAVSYFRLGVIKRTIPLKVLARLERWLQPTGKFYQWSPSIFTRNQAFGDSPNAHADTFFKCPACAAYNLQPLGARIICLECSRQYPIRDGIFDFRLQAE
jgi:ubiquinone/menaquinone biosynthesis C-methylase UbiE